MKQVYGMFLIKPMGSFIKLPGSLYE